MKHGEGQGVESGGEMSKNWLAFNHQWPREKLKSDDNTKEMGKLILFLAIIQLIFLTWYSLIDM